MLARPWLYDWLSSLKRTAQSLILAIIATAIAPEMGVAQEATASASLPPPNVVLASSASPTAPASPTGGMQLINDLDRPGKSSQDRGNWVVAPIPFRNELLGFGLVLGAGYLYGADETQTDSRHSIAAAGGMYAEGGSWTAIAAHRGYWSGQRHRTTVAYANGELVYDIELDAGDTTRKLGLKQELSGLSLEFATRVGRNGWIGLGYRGGETTVLVPGFDEALPAEFGAGTTIEMSNVLLDGEFDSRDSDLYARSGHYGQIETLIARHELGSDNDYVSVDLEWNSYRSMGTSHVLAWRLAGKLIDGDAPFFAMSWFGAGVDLRGYTPGRYIGESMIAAQAEWRWQATPRWGFVGFGGAGKVSGAIGDIDTDPWLPAAGVGVRFKLTRELPLNLRADFAWGRDDSTFTLAVGEAF